MDHGYEVDADKRCSATTKKVRQCQMPPLRGIKLCALHSGLAKPRLNPRFGDRQALEAFRRSHTG